MFIIGLVSKQDERVILQLFWRILLLCRLLKIRKYITAGSAAISWKIQGFVGSFERNRKSLKVVLCQKATKWKTNVWSESILWWRVFSVSTVISVILHTRCATTLSFLLRSLIVKKHLNSQNDHGKQKHQRSGFQYHQLSLVGDFLPRSKQNAFHLVEISVWKIMQCNINS